MQKKIERALLSVSDKTGIVELAHALAQANVEILSTGGTYKLLKEHNISVIEVSDYTGFPEIMDGRVKTLHPKIHGGILGRRDKDAAVMESHQINAISLVVVNLYPFEQTIAKENCRLEDAIENIDIGGPTMIRAAAKNYDDVSVVVSPLDYSLLLDSIVNGALVMENQVRFHLAIKAYEHTARYDGAIAQYFGRMLDLNGDAVDNAFPRTFNLQFQKQESLRYGENPHQKAAFYREQNHELVGTIAGAQQLQGKPLSFNNIADADSAWECVQQFDQPACVIVKHANPCGVAVGKALLTAYQDAFKCDPTSAFGGIIAFNRSLDLKTAEAILEKQFVEVIIAPGISSDAETALQQKKNVRVLQCGERIESSAMCFDFKKVSGGLLIQEQDLIDFDPMNLKVVTKRQPTEKEMADLIFAWRVAQSVKSNAIVYAKNEQTVGIGAGQMSRVYSAKVACLKAEEENLSVKGSVMASDAFFPFRDGIDTAADAGITAVIHPGGSMRDQEVIDAADEHDVAMVLTGIRHFKH